MVVTTFLGSYHESTRHLELMIYLEFTEELYANNANERTEPNESNDPREFSTRETPVTSKPCDLRIK